MNSLETCEQRVAMQTLSFVPKNMFFSFRCLSRYHWMLIFANLLYLLPVAIWLGTKGEIEFLFYVGVLFFLLGIIIATIHKTHFPIWLLILLSVWAGVHVAGGLVPSGDTVLYGKQFVHLFGEGDSYVLKFDQIVHFYGFFVTTFVVYWLLLPQLKKSFRLGAVAFIAMLASMGFGAINEVLEFVAVLIAPETGVGGYYNTAIDLVSNMLGALTASLTLVFTKIGISSDADDFAKPKE